MILVADVRRPLPSQTFFIEGQMMKKIDVDDDTKRSKFLIKAMVLQVILVLVLMFVFWAYLTA
jgi:hypothetical protein